jgi:hypothetical protein
MLAGARSARLSARSTAVGPWRRTARRESRSTTVATADGGSGADPGNPAVVVQQRDRRLGRVRRRQHVRQRQHLVGEVPGQAAHAELGERARLAPGGGDGRIAEEGCDRAGGGDEVVSGTRHGLILIFLAVGVDPGRVRSTRV